MKPKTRKRSAKAERVAPKRRSTRSVRRPARRSTSSGVAVRSVHDTARLVPGERAPNTSAFKTPKRAFPPTSSARTCARKRLVTKLIPRPEPAPPADVAKSVKRAGAAGQAIPRHEGPHALVPRKLLKSPVRRQVRIHVLGLSPQRVEAAVQRPDAGASRAARRPDG